MQNISLNLEVNDRTVRMELLSREGSKVKIKLDDKEYNIDIEMVERGVYSVLSKGKSFNIELAANNDNKKYQVLSYSDYFEVEVVDALTTYMRTRNDSSMGASENTISSPMPGKVVKIPVSVGDEVKAGDILIIISAMKMESEYESPIDGVVTDIFVKEEDTIDGNQPLVYVE